MRFFIKLIVIVLLFSISASAVSIKANILDANITTYKQLLTTLSRHKKSNDQVQLQILLLKTLIQFKQIKIADVLKAYNIVSSNEYADLFTKYLNILQDSIADKLKAEALSAKLKLLKNQINLFTGKKDKLLTLQLQYTYYAKLLKNYKIQMLNTNKILIGIKTTLNKSLGKFAFSAHDIHMKYDSLQGILLQVNRNVQKLEIQEERYKLLGYEVYVHKVNQKISQYKDRYNIYIKQLIVNQFLDFSYLLTKKDHKALMLQRKIIDNLKILQYHDQLISAIEPMFEKMQSDHFGGILYTFHLAMHDVKVVTKYLWHFATYSIFTINGTGISLFKFIFAVLIFVTGFFVGGKYKRKLKHVVFHKMDISIYARTIMANLGYYIILVATFFISLNIMGISLSSLALVAGALSVGIGFGLQNIVSNFVSGIILMFEKSIKVDDYVELADGTRGRVVDIRMRSTTLNTNDNIDLTIPNQTFIQNNVINWTMNDDIRRFEVPFDVNYGQKPEFIIKIILEAVQESGFKDVITTSTNFSRIIMTSLGDSSVNFSLFVWIKGDEIRHPKRTLSRFLILIYDTCYKYGVEISFPQRDLHIRSIDDTIVFPFKLVKQPD